MKDRPRMDVTKYWLIPPPEPSKGLGIILNKIKHGWRPNRRIRGMGYYESAEFYRVYIWEYLEVLAPILRGTESE